LALYHVHSPFHHMFQPCARGRQSGFDVLQHLGRLRRQVTLADDLPCGIYGIGTANTDGFDVAGHCDDRGVSATPEQALGIKILNATFHAHCPPSQPSSVCADTGPPAEPRPPRLCWALRSAQRGTTMRTSIRFPSRVSCPQSCGSPGNSVITAKYAPDSAAFRHRWRNLT